MFIKVFKKIEFRKSDYVKVYNKLVRDKIPGIMINNGAKPVARILNDKEFLEGLNKKLLEEVNEYLESGDILEIADIEEVILAILKVKNVSLDEFTKIRLDKVNKKGAFNKKIFLEKEE